MSKRKRKMKEKKKIEVNFIYVTISVRIILSVNFLVLLFSLFKVLPIDLGLPVLLSTNLNRLLNS